MIEIREADPTSDALRPVVEAHFAHSETAGPAESNHTMDAESLAGPGIRFWAMYEAGKPVGCGALKTLPDGTAEVKSVHIISEVRGRGLARTMMNHLAILAQSGRVQAKNRSANSKSSVHQKVLQAAGFLRTLQGLHLVNKGCF